MRFVLFFFCLSALHGKIIEVSNFHHIMEHVDEETLVLLDIDDTLLVPVQMLGSDEWFQYRFQIHQKSGLEKKCALDKTLAEWEAIRHITDMEIVEPGSEKIVKELQEKSFCVMGLTTQDLTLAVRTSEQLKKQQIDLSLTAPTQHHHYFSSDRLGVLYKHGILFTSGTCKGKALFNLCDAIGYHPKKIVFINDKATHLAEVEKVAHERNIDFVGLRYAYCDARKKAFCPEVAEYQFFNSSFAKLLSDEEVMQKIGLKKNP